jgi:putative Mg2+ transporter-C (MgtC) family protein
MLTEAGGQTVAGAADDVSRWMTTLLPYAASLGKLVLAGACGAAVGWEREAHEKSAGLRTHILMAIGACLFTLVGRDMVGDYPNVDIMRVIQGALIGTGFVCSGVIFRDRDAVRGLTTAAGLWIMGAVGVAVGFGYFYLAIVTTGLTFVSMTLLQRSKRRIRSHTTQQTTAQMPEGADEAAEPADEEDEETGRV